MDGSAAVEEILALGPDLAIVDLIMPKMNGIEVAHELRSRRCTAKILILSMVSDPQMIRRALAAGADGYVLKEADGEELLEALDTIITGRRFLSPTIRDAILEAQVDVVAPIGSPLDLLSPREREILPLVVQGFTSSEIGHRLGLAASTVDTYRSRIMAKLQVDSLANLVRFVILHDIGTA